MTGQPLKRTSLYDCHLACGAKIVPFAGWEMPVQYGGVVEEHLAVRQRAGLFDVSHMGEIEVRGPGAPELLQKLTCNDVSRLSDGKAHYSAITTERGCFVDDVLVHRLAADAFFLCVNAANVTKDTEWIRQRAGGDTEVLDRSDDYALLALQGPAAAGILSRVAGGAPSRLKRYRFETGRIDGVETIIARTGYTGEDGFELYLPPADAAGIWNGILKEGRADGLVPAGLAARDTLRLEAKLALYGNDIDETTTVFEAALGWMVKLGKGEFVGREALMRQKQQGVGRLLVGFEMIDRGIARRGYEVRIEGKEVGKVTSGSHAPFLGKSVGLAYLPTGHHEPGQRLEVVIRGRPAAAKVVPTPFYRRKD